MRRRQRLVPVALSLPVEKHYGLVWPRTREVVVMYQHRPVAMNF